MTTNIRELSVFIRVHSWPIYTPLQIGLHDLEAIPLQPLCNL